jgi:hypothetical protein
VVVLVPLDDRPVNTTLPQAVGRIGGVTVELPPASLLPAMRDPGDPDGLAAWLADQAARPEVDALIVSADGLAQGGLIASRTSDDALTQLLDRLHVLTTIKAGRPALQVWAFGTVTRASNGTVTDEEPDYWSHYGPALHEWGSATHRAHLAHLSGQAASPGPDPAAAIPAEVRHDFQRRRLRNHVVLLELLRMRSAGTLDHVTITFDDTAPHSAGSLEQLWVEQWRHVLDLDDVLMYPGADEVAATLVARRLVTRRQAGRAASRVRLAGGWVDEDGMGRVPPFENQPYVRALRRQVAAAGAELVRWEDRAAADGALVVHAPGPDRHDWCSRTDPGPGTVAGGDVRELVDLVAQGTAEGLPVGLVDVRDTNGGDPALIDELVGRDLVRGLVAYGGWNTAGNATGSTVATLVAAIVGAGAAEQVEREVLSRMLEDVTYQSRVRAELDGSHGVRLTRDATSAAGGVTSVDLTAFADQVRVELDKELARLSPRPGWRVAHVSLPWHRSFEVALQLTAPTS